MAAAGGGGRLALLLLLLAAAAAARLYRAGEDPLTVLAAGSVRRALLNSSAAWVVQFYSSSCGHCIAFAPTWRALAGDVKGEEPPPPPGSDRAPALRGAVAVAARVSTAPPGVRPGCCGPDPLARRPPPPRPPSGPRAAAVGPRCRCWNRGRGTRVGRSGASPCLGAHGHPWGAGLPRGLGGRGWQRGLGLRCPPWASAVPCHVRPCFAWAAGPRRVSVVPLLASPVAGTAIATLPEWHTRQSEAWMVVASLQIRGFMWECQG